MTSPSAVSVDFKLRAELQADVRMLAETIGERHLQNYSALSAAAQFIEKSFSDAGLTVRRESYDIQGMACHNIEAQVQGRSPEIVVVGGHYDSVLGCPGANDNATGVAATLALARRFAASRPNATLRFVGFVNEEPPYFHTPEMGSFVYARRCKERSERISAMISLETIGHFSDEPRSQTYPLPGISAFYPTRGNFIGFVGNMRSRGFLRRAISLFRQKSQIPARGATLPSFIPGVAWSDHWSFWQHGYPGIMITDTAPFRYLHYHRASDTPDKLEYDRFSLVVSGVEQLVAALAGR